jgi:hypothetical protein
MYSPHGHSRKLTFSSQVLNLEDIVVVVGEYYYSHRTKGIEKRSHKRKRGDTTRSQSSTKRFNEWELGSDPKENSIHATYVLHAFAGENTMSIYEVTIALDTAQAKIVELEKKLSTQQEGISVEFLKAIEEKEENPQRRSGESCIR